MEQLRGIKRVWLLKLDVKNAFLNGELDKEDHMDSPPGFENNGRNNLVCKLKESLYSLQQSPKAWNDLEEMERLKGIMVRGFEIKNRGPLRYARLQTY
ncbi:Retrovirus-related Pol polyprotein from transposon RE1 [Vitis vinifera]|uniref:Retrovirus-related Pol polyprotein from transposon RE1 n=1 Tax=Vitis vinifera TaxID=29760 RepID=A0A438IQH3_VITVI|nr:Retrovirus-related Pol polyprotein from transposon RE1 [Vitis vinifera]